MRRNEMHVRREVAADTLSTARKILGHWERRLRKPDSVKRVIDGMGNTEDMEIPDGAMVAHVLGEEDTIKMRAELAAVSATLEGLAGT
jgi:hypothetical protein